MRRPGDVRAPGTARGHPGQEPVGPRGVGAPGGGHGEGVGWRHPTPLERTLCERIASCWLDVQLADLVFAAKRKAGMSFAADDYYQRRQDRAHARFLAAVQALARVRRLLAPVVAQVNIAHPGEQEVNLAAPGPPPVRRIRRAT